MKYIYRTVQLKDMLEEIGEPDTVSVLSDFSCPYDSDIEYFIKKKSIPFEKAGVSRTHLVFCLEEQKALFVGFYSLASKPFFPDHTLSKTERKRYYGTTYSAVESLMASGCSYVNSILLGQLSKNFNHGYDKYITGDILINLAFERIINWYQMYGGITIHLDCRDEEIIMKFYERHGFVRFSERISEDGIKYHVYVMALKNLIREMNKIEGKNLENVSITKLK